MAQGEEGIDRGRIEAIGRSGARGRGAGVFSAQGRGADDRRSGRLGGLVFFFSFGRGSEYDEHLIIG